MIQPDLFGNDEARQRLATELKATKREEPAYRAGLAQRGVKKRKGYPAEAGYSNDTTSKAAAASMAEHLGPLQQRIYDYLKERPSTAREVEDALRLRTQTVTARIRELVLGERVEDSGLKRQTDSNRLAIVWRVKEGGPK